MMYIDDEKNGINSFENTNAANESNENKTESREAGISTSSNEYHYTYSRSDSSTANNSVNNEAPRATYQSTNYYAQPQQNLYSTGTSSNDGDKKSKSKSGISKGAIAAMLIICVLVSGGAGFGGAMLANKLTNKEQVADDGNQATSDGGSNVIYKSVNSEENDGTVTTGTAISKVAEMASDSVVEIVTEEVTTSSFFGNYVTSGAGSGVILTESGYIITCAHVVEDSDAITVTLTNGNSYDAKLIGSDSTTDIAVIKIEADGLTPCVIGDSSKLIVGEDAIVIGNPLGKLGGSVTSGIISALDRQVEIDDQLYTVLQTNAAINPGNSGGGLFNINGELIGVVNAKSSGDNVEGLGFAIPINSAMEIAEQLIDNGYVKGRPLLGIYVQEITDSTSYWTLRSSNYSSLLNYITDYGVYFTAYNTDAGQIEGDLQFGDRIIALDGVSVATMSDISALLNSEYKVGDIVKVTVARITNMKNSRTEMVDVEITLIENTNSNG